jgi:H+/Cl- antiporter ClcA
MAVFQTINEKLRGAFHSQWAPEGVARRAAVSFAAFFKWVFFGVLTGLLAGGAGTLFYFCIARVTGARQANPWLLWLLPVGGLAIVFSYRKLGVTHPQGTDLVIEAVRSPEPVPLKMAPLIFFATSVTHLFGGSAGREGAALQLGGSLGYGLGRVFRLEEKDLHILTMSGMAACFSALFGTPVTATVFVMELVTVGVMYYSALVPCAAAAVVAVSVARMFGVPPTRFPISGIQSLQWKPVLSVTVLAALCALLSAAFCYIMRGTGRFLQHRIRSPYLRAAVGGAAVIALSFLFGRDYLGMGGDTIAAAMGGHAAPAAFALKLLFTAITLGAGFRGGEIVPAFFVGATFGCTAGGLLGLDPSFGAAVGFLSLFCGITNCPVTAFVLSMEVFGSGGADYYLIAAAVSYMLSGYTGIYSKQKILYSKLKPLYLGSSEH